MAVGSEHTLGKVYVMERMVNGIGLDYFGKTCVGVDPELIIVL